MFTCEINVLNLLVFGGFPGKDLLPIYVPFSSCKIEGFFTFRCYFAGSITSEPLLVEVQRYKRCKMPLNYSHSISIEAPLWDKGKDLVREPQAWDVSSSLLGWKNPSCNYRGERNGGDDKIKGVPPSRKGLGSKEMQGAPIFQVHPTRATQLHLPFGNTEAFQNFYKAGGEKLKWGTGREITNQETPPWQEGIEATKKKGEKWIRNWEVILHFKYRRFSKRKKPGRFFFFNFFLFVLLLSVSLTIQVLLSWDFHFSGFYSGQNPNNPVQNQKKKPTPKVGHQVLLNPNSAWCSLITQQ